MYQLQRMNHDECSNSYVLKPRTCLENPQHLLLNSTPLDLAGRTVCAFHLFVEVDVTSSTKARLMRQSFTSGHLQTDHLVFWSVKFEPKKNFSRKLGKKVSSWHHFCVMHSEVFMHHVGENSTYLTPPRIEKDGIHEVEVIWWKLDFSSCHLWVVSSWQDLAMRLKALWHFNS